LFSLPVLNIYRRHGAIFFIHKHHCLIVLLGFYTGCFNARKTSTLCITPDYHHRLAPSANPSYPSRYRQWLFLWKFNFLISPTAL
jgi:hypothetical protein